MTDANKAEGASHENEAAKIDAEWERTLPLAEKVREAGGFAAYVKDHVKEVAAAFTEGQKVVCCMDERVGGKMNSLAIAASGLLLDDAEWEEFKDTVRDAGTIEDVHLHEGCGAEALYAELAKVSPDKAHEKALERARELKEFLGLSGDVKVLPVEPNFHNAQAAYIPLTEKFDITKVEGIFPPGFVISAHHVPLSHVATEAGVAVDRIAFGGHAFGNRFTSKHPFTFVVVADSEEELQGMMQNPDLKAHEAKHGGRVVIDGFVAPKAVE